MSAPVHETFDTPFGELSIMEQIEVPGVGIQVTSKAAFSPSTGRAYPPVTTGAFLQDEDLERLVDALGQALRNLRRRVES